MRDDIPMRLPWWVYFGVIVGTVLVVIGVIGKIYQVANQPTPAQQFTTYSTHIGLDKQAQSTVVTNVCSLHVDNHQSAELITLEVSAGVDTLTEPQVHKLVTLAIAGYCA